MIRTVNAAFEELLSRLTPTGTQVQAGARHRGTVETALKGSLTVRRFFETGSFSHGTGVRGYSDIDALVSLNMTKPNSSYTALTWVKEALVKTFPKTPIRISRPAVVVKFGAGYETWEVIPGFITNRGGEGQLIYDIPGPSAGAAWIDTAPDEHLAYVNNANKKPHQGDAKDLARLVKAWKYYRSVPISSFYLEMRAAEHVLKQKHYIHIWDICQLLESLNGHGLASMNDPKRAAGRIYACSSDVNLADARSKLSRAATRARLALDAHNANKHDDAFYYLNMLFNGKFPSRHY